MKMSDEEYFRSCVAKERRLAQLLGYQHIEEYCESAGTLWVDTTPLPQWTRDWKACGPLMTRFDITVHYPKEEGQEHGDCAAAGPIVVHFSDYPSKERAVMAVIVKAAIALLEHAKSHKAAHRAVK